PDSGLRPSFYAGVTPRGHSSADRERDHAFLESLRSPIPIDDEKRGAGDAEREREDDLYEVTRGMPGGWGLGPEGEVKSALNSGDESLNWDKAQAVVERMVGMSMDTVDGATLPVGSTTTAPASSPSTLTSTPTPTTTSISRRRRMT
ncbi:hypothetical protein EW145_g4022, partial [Phellinidium pouzarii]